MPRQNLVRARWRARCISELPDTSSGPRATLPCCTNLDGCWVRARSSGQSTVSLRLAASIRAEPSLFAATTTDYWAPVPALLRCETRPPRTIPGRRVFRKDLGWLRALPAEKLRRGSYSTPPFFPAAAARGLY